MIRNARIIASHFSRAQSYSHAINGRLAQQKLGATHLTEVYGRRYFAASILYDKVTTDVDKIVDLLRTIPTKCENATIDMTNALLPNANVNGFDSVAKGMWQLVRNKEYRVAGVAFETLIPIMKQAKAATSTNKITEDAITNIILAAMVANGSLLRPAKVNKIWGEHLPLPSTDSRNSASFQIVYNKDLVNKLLSALFHSYAVADKLDIANQFIREWLKCDIDTFSGSDTKSIEPAKVLYRQLSVIDDNQPSEQLDPNIKGLFQLLRECNIEEVGSIEGGSNSSSNRIPLEVWSTAVRMYSVRRAWTHCLYILNHIESSDCHPLGPKKAQSAGEPVGISRSRLDQLENLLDFSYLIEARGCDSADRSTSKSDVESSQNDRSSAVAGCISTIYHHTITALCHGHQFESALKVLVHMREVGIAVEVVSTVSLMQGLYCSSPSRTYSITPENIVHSRKLALGLFEEVLATVQHLQHAQSTFTTTTTSITKNSATSRSLQSRGSTSQSVPGTPQTPSPVTVELARAYLTVLCELGLTATAHSLHGRLRAMEEEGEGHRGGTLSALLSHTLIESDQRRGDWRSAKDTYAYYSSPAQEKIEGERGGDLTTTNERGHGLLVEDSTHAPPNALPATPESLRSYHAVCSAMLRNGEVEELSAFIDLNHRLVYPPTPPEAAPRLERVVFNAPSVLEDPKTQVLDKGE
jgi:hypothetical protein